MESIITHFITEWGTFGLILALIIWLIYDNWKSSKNNNIKEVVTEIKTVSGKVDNLHDKISIVEDKVKIVDEKVDEVTQVFDQRIDQLENTVNELPQIHLDELRSYNLKAQKQHTKEMLDLMRLGPKLHETLKEYNNLINGQHIFVGSFHNGNRSITGIPYYKFDIIAERFGENKIDQDCEFAFMYKDSDILRFDKLPTLLVQEEMLHFTVPENGHTNLAEIDDVIWRRMRGRGIRQIALHILKDKSGTPSGFVGIIRYDFETINLNELHLCAKCLEVVYHESENKINTIC